ncbi:hypothetical protein ACRAWD_03380 [Caulobacter segnis]
MATWTRASTTAASCWPRAASCAASRADDLAARSPAAEGESFVEALVVEGAATWWSRATSSSGFAGFPGPADRADAQGRVRDWAIGCRPTAPPGPDPARPNPAVPYTRAMRPYRTNWRWRRSRCSAPRRRRLVTMAPALTLSVRRRRRAPALGPISKAKEL